MIPTNTCIIIPAAGSSSRLGQPKQLVEFEDETLIRRSTRIALEASDNVIVVTGCERDAVTKEIEDLPVFVVDNPEWELGMGKSIAVGVQAALDRFEKLVGVAVYLCDTPLIDAVHLSNVIETGVESEVVLTQYDETTGVPAYFGQSLFEQLSILGWGSRSEELSNKETDRECGKDTLSRRVR